MRALRVILYVLLYSFVILPVPLGYYVGTINHWPMSEFQTHWVASGFWIGLIGGLVMLFHGPGDKIRITGAIMIILTFLVTASAAAWAIVRAITT
jgi:hypothetical protein